MIKTLQYGPHAPVLILIRGVGGWVGRYGRVYLVGVHTPSLHPTPRPDLAGGREGMVTWLGYPPPSPNRIRTGPLQDVPRPFPGQDVPHPLPQTGPG